MYIDVANRPNRCNWDAEIQEKDIIRFYNTVIPRIAIIRPTFLNSTNRKRIFTAHIPYDIKSYSLKSFSSKKLLG